MQKGAKRAELRFQCVAYSGTLVVVMVSCLPMGGGQAGHIRPKFKVFDLFLSLWLNFAFSCFCSFVSGMFVGNTLTFFIYSVGMACAHGCHA